MILFHVCVMATAVLGCYILGDWRNWKRYYSTIQFFIMGDLIYNILFQDNYLWMYVSTILNHTLVNLLMAATAFSSTVLVFIPHFPKGIFKQVLYILFWVILYSAVEYLALRLGYFQYGKGWGIMWSAVFCLVMFPLLYLHYKKPLLAWVLALTELSVYLMIFDVNVLNLP